MRLIFVHGMAQEGKNPEQLKQHWYEVLQDNLQLTHRSLPEQLEVRLPFYGDVLHNLSKQLEESGPLDVTTKGAGAKPPVDAQAIDLALELASNAGLSLPEVEARLSPQVREKGPTQWEWVHDVLAILDQSVVLGEATLKRFTREVYSYLKFPAVSQAVDDIVREAVVGEGPCVVVAHSLGTLVAYRLLSDLAKTVAVRALITLGSPLGLNAIRSNLPRPLAMPMGVRKWQNAYDDRDVVALRPLDTTRWDIRPSIENYDGVYNGTDNAHSISGYLNDRQVGQWILSALTEGADNV